MCQLTEPSPQGRHLFFFVYHIDDLECRWYSSVFITVEFYERKKKSFWIGLDYNETKMLYLYR